MQRGVIANVYLLIIIGVLIIWGLIAIGIVLGRNVLSAPPTAVQTTDSAFKAGKAAPVKSPLLALDGKAATLALGRKATVVMGMSTWCRFCGYMDKWVLPGLAGKSGVTVDVVDVSPTGGIANPGPKRPAFSGTDGSGGTPMSVSGMEADLHTYTLQYGIANSGIKFYVAPASTQQRWSISVFPTVIVLNSRGVVSTEQPGAMTLAQLTAAVEAASDQH